MGFNLRYSFSYFTGPNIVLTFKRRDWYNSMVFLLTIHLYIYIHSYFNVSTLAYR